MRADGLRARIKACVSAGEQREDESWPWDGRWGEAEVFSQETMTSEVGSNSPKVKRREKPPQAKERKGLPCWGGAGSAWCGESKTRDEGRGEDPAVPP